MKFKEAFEEMKSGIPVKLPSWAGYWWWDEESQTILMYTKDGGCLDIRETQNVEYTLKNILSDEWVYADSRNCPILGGEATFSFGEAIKYLKRGMKVARKGWNGKGMYMKIKNFQKTKSIIYHISRQKHPQKASADRPVSLFFFHDNTQPSSHSSHCSANSCFTGYPDSTG